MIARNILILSKVVRTFITSCRSHRSHYDVLEVTPKATQNDIKTAYYRLSKLYHPDKSNDVESAKKFREITEAYGVLGNKNLRKMYDNESRRGEPVRKFYKSRDIRNESPIKTGKTTYFDYDTWYQNHYGFQESKYKENADILRRRRTRQTRNGYRMETSTSIKEIIALMLGVFIFFYFIEFNIDDTLDKPKILNKEQSNEVSTNTADDKVS